MRAVVTRASPLQIAPSEVRAVRRPFSQIGRCACSTGRRTQAGQRLATSGHRRQSLCCQALVLTPAGDGSTDHLDETVASPQEIKLSEGLFEIGREDLGFAAQIVIPYPTVSSRHARLRIAGDEVSVTDLGSTNGTYIDDNQLVPMEAETLGVGQVITFGDMYLAKYALEKRA